MQDYVVRSSITHAESAARRTADVLLTLFICAAVVFVLFRFIWVPVVTADPPVKELEDGELVLADRISRYFGEYKVGDVVRADIGEGMNMYRVAAPGGTSVTVRGGRLYVNGGLLDESEYASAFDSELDEELEVPEGSVLLLPDDRSGITELEGCVLPVSSVYGKLRLRICPLSRFTLFD